MDLKVITFNDIKVKLNNGSSKNLRGGGAIEGKTGITFLSFDIAKI